jgi:hypothetical protein
MHYIMAWREYILYIVVYLSMYYITKTTGQWPLSSLVVDTQFRLPRNKVIILNLGIIYI